MRVWLLAVLIALPLVLVPTLPTPTAHAGRRCKSRCRKRARVCKKRCKFRYHRWRQRRAWKKCLKRCKIRELQCRVPC